MDTAFIDDLVNLYEVDPEEFRWQLQELDREEVFYLGVMMGMATENGKCPGIAYAAAIWTNTLFKPL